jgi:squalene-hopene/tetraprenyl-beta-curcumene cyclase
MSAGTTHELGQDVAVDIGRARSLDDAIERGAARLLELQRPGGWWAGELESNVTITAQHLFFLEFLRLRDAETTERVRAELLARERGDGLWAIYEGAEPDLNATVEAYTALRLAGLDADAPELARAQEFCLARGGIGATRVFTRIWLSLLGLWSWDEVPLLPAELAMLPPSAPLSLYTFACWARQTVGALSVVMHYRPVRPIPEERAARELDLGPVGAGGPSFWDGVDALLRRYAHSPFKPGREVSLGVAEQWIIARQELDGSWGGIQPPWVWSVIALICRGHGPDSPYVQKGVRGWERFLLDEGERRRPEACQSPVWDTALAVLGLRAAGVPADHPGLVRAGDWLLAEEVGARGDWSVRLPGTPPGGWAFEYDNDIYPDVDDAAVVGLALEELGRGEKAVRRACDWIAAMQSGNGGWGAFDVDNDAEWLYGIPFCDFGAVIDPPSVDVTAHAIELLAGKPEYADALERGVAYMLADQEADGSWFGRWGVNYVYGTGAVMPALEAIGYDCTQGPPQRALEWLSTRQNPDGGFGEDCRSYDPGAAGREWRGRGESTASQTAWALMGLVSGGAARSATARRAADWLFLAQRDDGDWDEAQFTGTGFPCDFLIRYDLYRIVWPMIALGRYRTALAREQ